ncbi:MAG: 3-oxoacyl-[acyl-carrier-protein] synthase III C-terminal domain-containing protein, partial [Planctomycetota bacterium]
NALFADGAAACVVRHPDDLKDARGLVSADTPMGIRGRASHVIPGTEGLMTWTIEDHGFAMTLDPKTPSAVAEVLPDWLDAWLAAQGVSRGDVAGWAIHPGGPRLLETVGGALGLSTEDLEASRGVLQNHGNMSSGTVLFILDALREAGTPGPWVAMAFGPGLTIEAALLG